MNVAKASAVAATNEATEISTDRITPKGKGPLGVVKKEAPYRVELQIEGVADILCHRYDVEAVAAKGEAKKGSKEKKSDNLESYVYRMADGTCGIPGFMLKAALCTAAKSYQDPRRPRASMYDLTRAGIVCEQDASFGPGVKSWDYLDTRRVVVQGNAVPRQRPAFKKGWKLTFYIQILTPEYISLEMLQQLAEDAGRLQGLGDFRPDFGRFRIVKLERLEESAAG